MSRGNRRRKRRWRQARPSGAGLLDDGETEEGKEYQGGMVGGRWGGRAKERERER